MSELYLGLDVGTQSAKAVVVDADAQRIVARAASPLELIGGLAEGAAEQHPDSWWAAVREVVRAVCAADGVDVAAIRGIGVSGQQHGYVPLDAEGRVIRAAKLWCDTETEAEARELSERLGRPVPTGFTASKILWMARHEPEAHARLATVMLPHDWVNFRLTGERVMECGDASGTGLFDVRERAFDAAALAAIDERLAACIPPLVEPGAVVGEVLPDVADELGLPRGVRIATGGGDNMMSAIGAGATRSGVVVASLGTSGTVFARSDAPIVDPEGLIAPFCDSAGAWLPLLCVMNVTNVTEEVAGLFPSMSLADLTAAAAEVPAGADGLMLLPYLQGERVPDLPSASASLHGIRAGRLTPGHLFRAALEGTSANLALGVERMRRLGLDVGAVRLVGGGARNPLWRQILADMLDAPVQALAEPESAALGGALQALWTVCRADGDARALDDLVEPFIEPDGDPVAPDAGGAAQYRELMVTMERTTARLWG